MNEGIVNHMERLAQVHQTVLAPRMGGDSLNGYEVSNVRKAIDNLAKEITTDDLAAPF